MRIAAETCNRCGTAVFEEDIESGAAVDELTRCLCPRCAPAHRKPAVRKRAHPPALTPVSTRLLLRVALLVVAAVLVVAVFAYPEAEHTVETTKRKRGKRTAVRTKLPTAPTLSREHRERLNQAAAKYRARRVAANKLLYRRTRDRALELMTDGNYSDAAGVIEQYPEELRTTATWEMRLAPLWREARLLDQAVREYERTLAAVVELLENRNCAGAAVLFEQYAASFTDTPWANEASQRAASLRKLQAVREKPEPATERRPPPPAPPRVPRAPEPKPEPKKASTDDKFKGRIKEAISRGVKHLEGLIKSDGSFSSSYSHSYPAGPTALALLALLKCGKDRDSDIIKNGFACLAKKPLRKIYSVSLHALALEAKFEPHGDEIDPRVPFEQQLKKRFARHATRAEKQRLDSIVTWLRDAQSANGMWSYTGVSTSTTANRRRRVGRGDGSNTQFAVLALYAAHRLGAAIPKETVSRLANTYLENQQKSGTKVKTFPVPAADISIAKLRREEKKALSRKEGPHTVCLDELYGGTSGRHSMRAKGWGYSGWLRSHPYLSMTCAGVCNMVLAKAVLERSSGYGRSREKIDQAIRDGAAYISRNLEGCMKSSKGAGRLGWGSYYTLYSVERAGMLTLCEKFGKHLWYKEGAELLLKLQGAGGSWGNCLEDTCFALLFLSRSTTPFIRTSGPTYTGSDLFPDRKKQR
jgi:hypothetical protein